MWMVIKWIVQKPEQLQQMDRRQAGNAARFDFLPLFDN